MVAAQLSCLNGHMQSWQSQPYIRGTPEGNLLLAASILLSGSTYKHVNGMAKLLRLSFIGKSAFYTLQENVLCGDGRCDSTGHSAKYGTYTLLNEKTGKIPAFSVVQVIEVTSSNAMEMEGCRRILNNVLSSNLQVPCLTTDKHISIISMCLTVDCRLVDCRSNVRYRSLYYEKYCKSNLYFDRSVPSSIIILCSTVFISVNS